MKQSPEGHKSPAPEDGLLRIDIGAVDFPSDALSMKRLRQSFPKLFDEGSLQDGYGLFFYPLGPDEPAHLVRLADLLSAERAVAEYAFYNAFDPYPSETLDDDDREGWAYLREELEQLYVDFKLADSPETARLLIRHIEEQGAQQGKAQKSRESRAR
jgi:hypothetical protein